MQHLINIILHYLSQLSLVIIPGYFADWLRRRK